MTIFALWKPNDCACWEQRNIFVSASPCWLSSSVTGLTLMVPLLKVIEKAKSHTVRKSSCFSVNSDEPQLELTRLSIRNLSNQLYYLNISDIYWIALEVFGPLFLKILVCDKVSNSWWSLYSFVEEIVREITKAFFCNNTIPSNIFGLFLLCDVITLIWPWRTHRIPPPPPSFSCS